MVGAGIGISLIVQLEWVDYKKKLYIALCYMDTYLCLLLLRQDVYFELDLIVKELNFVGNTSRLVWYFDIRVDTV